MTEKDYDSMSKHALGSKYTLPSIPASRLADTDAKVEAIVKFIAKRAAEKDYAELLRAINDQETTDTQEQ